MPKSENFVLTSYSKHIHEFSAYGTGGQEEKLGKAWLTNGTVNEWLHLRLWSLVDAVLNAYPKTTWVTVGDGRYGNDARYLHSQGINALPTNISDDLLREAKEAGLISSFSTENAEQLSFPDGEFDFAYCKEAYHHFPRAPIAMHEMLRVSRKGIFLIEPNDVFASPTLAEMAKRFIFSIIGRRPSQHMYEPVGNYVYSLSRREIEKLALGMGLTTVAYKGLNTHYIYGVEFEPKAKESKLWRRVRRRLRLLDVLCKLGIIQYGYLATLILKVPPSIAERDALSEGGFSVVDLPKNPYA